MSQQVVTVARVGQRRAAIDAGCCGQVGRGSKPDHCPSVHQAGLSGPGKGRRLEITMPPSVFLCRQLDAGQPAGHEGGSYDDDDWPLVLANLHRAVRPGGVMYLTVEEAAQSKIDQAFQSLSARTARGTWRNCRGGRGRLPLLPGP